MHPREFLALADQLAAFQAIMSGSLKKETEEAKQAINALGSAQSLAKRETFVKSEEAGLVSRKEQVEQELKTLKEEVLAKAKLVAKNQEELDAKLVELSSQEQASKHATVDLEKATLAFDKREKTYLEKTSKASNELEKKQAEVQAYEESIKVREDEVQKKLDVIKSLG